eukprot:CAMPEP_0201123926 /NCGR_PEP_ID=MMETSP0850-20130426/9245_1 /ASSEMBLY_ACC=CAM_ASM_000622 /TAXON_ID=183588 /ORGANISM="Pseudo-nitzschia fraudulenta, Strain WWA7" /LENGTH=106 /DNA_ID=CAMNT_0047391045 /DNA_START=86 /DNA_END=406 /DNA_ORIENTATION=+
MIQRILLLVVLAVAAFSTSEAFAPVAFPKAAELTSSTSLFGCRVNAKKEKIKRNRENMRKFSSPGKRGTSRRKVLKKAQASEARQKENEFITKCFITGTDSDEAEE